MGMWALFGKSFERNLLTGFGLDRAVAKTVAAKAKPRYKEIIAGLPGFEKGDRFKMNIVNCALLSAFVLNMPERPDVRRLTAYYSDSMMTPAMKWFCRKRGKSKFTKKDISSMKATERLRAADRPPIRGTWSFFPIRTAAAMKHAFPPAAIWYFGIRNAVYQSPDLYQRLSSRNPGRILPFAEQGSNEKNAV